MVRNYRERSRKNKKQGETTPNRSQRQKEKILKVSGRLFYQKGFLGTSVDDIAKAGSFNKASIYYYFKNKTQVLYQIAITIMSELFENARPIANYDIDPEKKLEALITNHLKVELSNPGLAGIGQQERRNLTPTLLKSYVAIRDEYESLFFNVIKEVLNRHKAPAQDAKLVTLFTLGLLNSPAQWYKSSGRFNHEEITKQAISYIFHAISVPLKDSQPNQP